MYKFEPKHPFALNDPEKGRFNKDSEFLDGIVREQIDMGGVQVNIYRLLGTFAQTRDALGLKTDPGAVEGIDLGTFLGIQDPILNENRDREYDFVDIPVMKGVYQVSQNDLEYAKWGLDGLTGDVITMEFHLQATEQTLGRRFIPGDVVEMPHLREVSVDGRPRNKWYEVASVVKSPGGYDPMYAFHVLGVILRPMRDAQEFADIMNRKDEYGKTLGEQAGTRDAMVNLTSVNQQIADQTAHTTWWDTTPMYIDPTNKNLKPFRWTDDAKAPNGIQVPQGTDFPTHPNEFDYYLRSDFFPNRLFQFYDNRWHLKETDHKRDWQPYNWVVKLREFMSDRSDADKARAWELKSIHDVITPREDNSDPSYDDSNPLTGQPGKSSNGELDFSDNTDSGLTGII